MKERRNFYRTLHVQPDAPPGVIRTSYRTLMQKLRLHPDLGGDHRDASAINIAYATLRDARRRARYDRELLRHYGIDVLGRGGMAAAPGRLPPDGSSGNLRNFYRVLQVQPDSPTALIEASYRTLRDQPGADLGLLDEAYATLCDPGSRARYDRRVAQGGHRAAASPAPPPATRQTTAAKTAGAVLRGGQVMVPAADASSDEEYQPAIRSYCAFCKTPHAGNNDQRYDISCVVCRSPLSPPPPDLAGETRRAISRMDKEVAVSCFVYWPGPRLAARTLDLSPAGARLVTAAPLEPGDIVKIDATGFEAVGRVAHAQRVGDGIAHGVEFLAARFTENLGTFVSTTA